MPETISAALSTRRITTHSGAIRAQFAHVNGTQVLVLADHRGSHKPGTIFVRNHELERRSKNRTTHMAFPGGCYEAFRSGNHVVRHGGIRPNARNGEMHELVQDIVTARAYVGALLASGSLSPQEFQEAEHVLAELIAAYSLVRNDAKVQATSQFQRSMGFHDKLGRRNPSAAGMITGRGIQQLLNRKDELRFIGAAVDARTIHVYQAIEAHMDLYRDFRRALNPNSGNQGMLYRLMREEEPTAETYRRVRVILQDYEMAFSSIRAEPFRRNAFYLLMDIRHAVELAIGRKRSDLLEMFAKFRRGITWVFAQYALEMEVIAPLSFLIEDNRRLKRSANRKAKRRGQNAEALPLLFTPYESSRLVSALARFRSKLALCSDEGLQKPVKQVLTAYIDTAASCMQKQEWHQAKRALKQASHLL